MRIALAAAISVACLVMPAHAASFETVVSSGAVRPSGAQMDETMSQAFWLHAKGAATAPASIRQQIESASHFRAEHHLLEYYPFEDSRLHLSFGMQKDKRLGGARPFNLRGIPMFGASAMGVKRKVSPGFAIAYDQPVAYHTKLNFDIGMRKDRDAMASQLNRLAALDSNDRSRLGAHSSRFGPAAHLTFIHTF